MRIVLLYVYAVLRAAYGENSSTGKRDDEKSLLIAQGKQWGNILRAFERKV